MNKKRVTFDIVTVVLWMCVIFFMSTDFGSAAHTNSILDILLKTIVPHWYQNQNAATLDLIHYIVRKIAHLTEYAILACLIYRAFRDAKGIQAALRYTFYSWGIATLYSSSDEIHQIFVAGRTPLFTDVMIDSTGALIGLIIFNIIVMKRQKLSLSQAITTKSTAEA